MSGLGLTASHNTLTHVEILQKLRERRRRWDTLDHKTFITLQIDSSCQAYELVGGVFGQTDGTNITFCWLPSSTSKGRRIDHQSPIPLRDFAMDPSQDLLVILEQNSIYYNSDEGNVVVLHLRTMSTNLPHEKATRTPKIEFNIPPDNAPAGNGIVGAALYIMRHLLSINLRIGSWTESRCRVLIFNWITGSLVYDSDQFPLYHDFEDFEILDDDLFIMSSHDGCGSLHLYTFDSDGYAKQIPPTQLCAFKLPTLSKNSSLVTSVINHDPCVAFPSASDDQPFRPRLNDGLLVFSLTYHIGHDEECNQCTGSTADYTLIVPSGFLFRCVAEKMAQIRDSQAVEPQPLGRVYEWDEWGPSASRLLHPCVPKGWLRFLSGQQVAVSSSNGNAVDQALQILDFSRHPDSRTLTDDTTILYVGRDVPTEIVDPSPFEEDVMTHLPYHRIIKSSLAPCQLYMMDEQRIIGVTLSDDLNGSRTVLHVYTF
ncbi:hypothetical protein CVT24_000577 [Panaeolus cyanescens]|uniref:Cleavage/polyadenylation specificity factor A subunit N-terminal domain-containing protein n=1 Tax=Panaeolus cyanescens TaxID=181874 RepID=A0A409YDE5_9AGAR|nr:hypothetical protein CVT24_000577 [Panaeolus cyanescens]